MPDYQTLIFTTDFTDSLLRLSPVDLRRVFRALRILDADERHPSLQVHRLTGQQAGTWTAYASRNLRITFERIEGGRKRLRDVSQHYGD
jgi:hypothetical protein